MQYILADADVRILVTSSDALQQQPDFTKVNCVLLDQQDRTIMNYPDNQPERQRCADDLAYVLYTSGSTGHPKGVMIPHRALANNIISLNCRLQVDENSVYLHTASFSFSSSCRQLFLPLVHGAQIVIASDEDKKNPIQLFNTIKTRQVTHIDIVPTYWKMCNRLLLDMPEQQRAACLQNHLQFVFTASEKMEYHILSEWYGQLGMATKWINMYGQTETSGICITSEVVEHLSDVDQIVMGRPLENTKVFVLDKRRKLLPFGFKGELYVQTGSIMSGYLNLEDASRSAMVDLNSPDINRFLSSCSLYKTGDVVKWGAQNNLEYIGRTDFQIKFRGIRISPAEISNKVEQYPGVSQALVDVKEVLDEQYLVAYYVIGSNQQIDQDALQAFLRDRLISFMVPTFYVGLEVLPTTLSGKIDRKSLPMPHVYDLIDKNTYVAPQTVQQQTIVALFSEVLGLDKVSMTDNFFKIGGNSLNAMQLIARVQRKIGLSVEIKSLFAHPIIEDFIAHLTEAEGGKTGREIVISSCERSDKALYPLSAGQEALWFIDQYAEEETSNAYNTLVVLSLNGKIDFSVLQQSFRRLILRHEALRTAVVTNKDGVGCQILPDSSNFPYEDIITEHYLSEEAISGKISQLINTRFLLEQAPLMRAQLLRFEDAQRQSILVIVCHHIISDGWSNELLVQELFAFYQEMLGEQPSNLSDLSMSHIDFACWQRDYMSTEDFSDEIAYWRQKLQGFSELQLNTDKARPAVFCPDGDLVCFELSTQQFEKIKRYCQKHGMTTFAVLFSCFSLLMSKYTGQEDIVIGTPVSTRYTKELEQVIGLLINVLVLRTQISGDQDFDELVSSVSQNIIEALDHQTVPFEKVIEALGVKRDPSRNPIFQVMFSMGVDHTKNFGKEGISCNDLEIHPYYGFEYKAAKFDLTLHMQTTKNQVLGQLEYATDLFHRETVQRMAEHFQLIVESVFDE